MSDPTTHQDDAELQRIWAVPPGFWGRLAATNNQVIGKRFMLTALIFFLLAMFMALVMRVQLAVPDNTLVGPKVYNVLFTMHGSVMMYLFIVPFLEGLAVYMLPLVIGSRDLAFPRLSAFGYWTYFLGGALFFASFTVGSPPDMGWFAYTPLSGPRYSGLGADLWLMGLGLVEVGGIAAAAELVVTILKLRAPGMTLTRMPLFAWAWLVTAVMILFAFTTLFTATMLLELDRSIGTQFFSATAGGSDLLWQHLFWFFGHPEVYIMFLPAVGMISMIVPAMAGRPIAAYSLLVVAFVVMGFLSFGLWAHHMFTTGIPWLSLSFFTAASLAIALTTGTMVFSYVATLWGMRPRWRMPLLYSVGFVLLFVVGGMTGIMVAVVPFDLQVHDTYFIVAHLHYVIIGGVVFPILAATHYWLPKITGRMLSERLGWWSFWLIFLGFNLTFFPMHVLGLWGMPRRVYTFASGLGLETQNMIASAGAFVLAAGFLLFVVDALRSLKHGPPAPDDPWGGETLEWAISSPPPIYSFYRPPVVASRHPLWRGRPPEPDAVTARAVDALAKGPPGLRATLSTDVLTGRPESVMAMPQPSLVPLATAAGLLVAAIGALFKFFLVVAAGLIVAAGCVVVWLWPTGRTIERVRRSGVELTAGLPVYTTGPASAAWWGMVCLIAVLAMVFGVLVYSYFYIRLYAETWPQGGLPRPGLLWPGLAYGALLASAGAMAFAVRGFAAAKLAWIRLGLGGAIALGVAFLGLLAVSLAGAGFGWHPNAYASVFHVTNWTSGLVTATALAFAVAALFRVRPASGLEGASIALQMQLTGMLWYAAVALGAAAFATLYLSPYLL